MKGVTVGLAFLWPAVIAVTEKLMFARVGGKRLPGESAAGFYAADFFERRKQPEQSRIEALHFFPYVLVYPRHRVDGVQAIHPNAARVPTGCSPRIPTSRNTFPARGFMIGNNIKKASTTC